jgi:hypothetical protein
VPKRAGAQPRAKQADRRDRLYPVALVCGVTLVSLPAILFCVCSLFLLAGLGLDSWSALCLAIAVVLTMILNRELYRSLLPGTSEAAVAGNIGFAAAVCLLCFWAGGVFMDVSGDGQWYHQEAIGRLATGWNPVYEKPSSGGYDDRGAATYIECYPHGLWIDQAVIYQITQNLERPKGWNFVLAAATALLAFAALRRVPIGAWGASLLALIVAANPVVMYQAFTYYNDGCVYAMLACVIALAVIQFRSPNRLLWWPFASTLILLVNTKFTGLAYAIGLVGTGALLYWIQGRYSAALKQFVVTSAGAGCVAVVLFGFSPYILNTFRYGSPLYPWIGGPISMHPWKPAAALREHGNWGALVYGIFGEPGGAGLDATPRLKPLFTFSQLHAAPYKSWPDPGVGGYGILFGEALLLALPVFAVALVFAARTRRWKELAIAGVLLAAIAGSVVIKDAAWYARYNAQFVLVPVVMLSFVLVVARAGATPRYLSWLTAPAIILLIANVSIVTFMNWREQRDMTRDVQALLLKLKRLSATGPLPVYFSHLRSNRIRWVASGIQFDERKSRDDLNCAKPVDVWINHLYYCSPSSRP